MSFLVYRTVCGTLATGSELFHLYLRHDATDKWTGLKSLKGLIRDNCQLFDVSPSYVCKYSRISAYTHSFNLRYTTCTKDIHLHRTEHLLLGKAYVNSTSIQARDICGFSDTNTLTNTTSETQSLRLLHRPIRKQTTQREPDCSTHGLDSRRDQQSKGGM